MEQVANILLIEKSAAGNLPRSFDAQRVEISHEEDTVVQGVDGHVSRGRHPSSVVWVEGRASDLRGVTNVKITTVGGGVLLDGELNTNLGVPSDTDTGVHFFVLAPSG